MNRVRDPKALFVVVALLGLACASTQDPSLIVLVSDEDGTVGSIAVSGPDGSAVLDEPGQTARVARPGEPLRVDNEPMPDEEIHRLFGDALAIQPLAPEVFTLYFDSSSSTLDAESRVTVDRAVAEIRARDSRDISINGHSDSTGPPEVNMQISLRRSESVRDRLVELGIDPETITVEYHGEGDPVVQAADGVDEPLNRRVEIIVR